MDSWQAKRVEAAARVFADGIVTEADSRRADAAVHAADRAVGGVVPLEEYEQLALDLSAWRVRADQADELLGRALQALDAIAASEDASTAELRAHAFASSVELRGLLDAQRETDDDDGAG